VSYIAPFRFTRYPVRFETLSRLRVAKSSSKLRTITPYNGNAVVDSRVIIIGAGPTGLGTGHRLSELGHQDFAIYERSGNLAGLAGSITDTNGFTWDIGVHVAFSHYTYFAECFDRAMAGDYQLNTRQSWVRMLERWIPYPLQNNIRHLPPEVTCECLIGLIKAQMTRDHRHAKNFKEFADAVFGDGIVKHFMQPYVSKAWACPLEYMNKDWVGERVPVIDIPRAIENVVLGKDDLAWGPNSQFKYPLHGGTGEFYRRLASPLLTKIHFQKQVERIDIENRQVLFTDGESVRYEKLVTAMPLDVLCARVLDGSLPDSLRIAARSLLHSGGHMVGIGIQGRCPSSRSWMYFPEGNCPFHRASFISNFSPNMTPNNSEFYSVLCETSYSSTKSIDKQNIVVETVNGLVECGVIEPSQRDQIVDTWVFDAPYAYPTPTIDRDVVLAKIIPFLEQHDIYSRGRFGYWKYEVSNADHSFMQGVELVNRWILSEAESTIHLKYISTQDGRGGADHERPRS
jgi:protoporphyrinogen oxidase